MRHLALCLFLLATSIAPHALPQEVPLPLFEMRPGETATFLALPTNPYGDVVPLLEGQGDIGEFNNGSASYATVTSVPGVIGAFTVAIAPNCPPYAFITIDVAGGPATQSTPAVSIMRIFVTLPDQPNENAVTGFLIGRL